MDRHSKSFIVASLLLASVTTGDDVLARGIYTLGGRAHPWAEAASATLVALDGGALRPLGFGPDESVTAGLLERGGDAFAVNFNEPHDAVIYHTREEIARMADRDPDTAFETSILNQAGGAYRNIYYLDLGGVFLIDHIRFYPRRGLEHLALPIFDLIVNDGAPEHIDPISRWPLSQTLLLHQTQRSVDPIVDLRFSLRPVRYIGIDQLEGIERFTDFWEVAELEAYTEGFVPSASWVSPLLDLGGAAAWGDLRWWGHRDPPGKVFLATRTGSDDDPNLYWRRTGAADEIVPTAESGAPLTAQAYARLPDSQKGPITYDQEHWSFWSAPYDFEAGLLPTPPSSTPKGRAGEREKGRKAEALSPPFPLSPSPLREGPGGGGTPISSPGPQRYLQVKMDFTSTLQEAGQLDSLSFDFSLPPLAHSVVGEIAPLEAKAGERVPFTYALKAGIGADDHGFDAVELTAPALFGEVQAVRLNGAPVPFQSSLLPDGTGFIVRLADLRMGPQHSEKLLEVDFEATVLRYGTQFVGRILDSRSDEVAQRVAPGDATVRLGGDDIAVRTPLGGPVLSALRSEPRAFTPNGDGIHDRADFTYTLLKLTAPAPVALEVYDLSGRFIRRVHQGLEASGVYRRAWDGRDERGFMVPPGVYLYRLSVRADGGEERRAGAVSVVY